MTPRVVLDASVLLKAFSPHDERHTDRALVILDAWEAGRMEFVAPELLTLEVLNVAACKWLLDEAALHVLARALTELQIDVRPVAIATAAHWAAQGLTAYDAAYVAVAETARVPLVTDDNQLLRVAGSVAVPLASFTPG